MDNYNSNDFIRVELNETEIKEYLGKIVTEIEAKVLVNLLLKYLVNLDNKKICACELLIEDLEYFHEIREACYCLAYGTNYITYQKIDNKN
jgi:hypothetical protein